MTSEIFPEKDGYIDHPFLRDETVDYREYQADIAENAVNQSSLVALPTAAGKTIVAALVAAEVVGQTDGPVLFLAPNKPLVEQQKDVFLDVLSTFESDMIELNGEVRPDKREDIWEEQSERFIFATPQIIENDIVSGRMDIEDMELIVFDECHKATGDYAYSFIGEQYKKRPDGLALGMSASPGSNESDILQLCDTLGLKNVEIYSSDDPELEGYVYEPNINDRHIELDDEINEIKDLLETAARDCYKTLKEDGYLSTINPRWYDFQDARANIQEAIDSGDSDAYGAMSVYAEATKLFQAVKKIDTQTVSSLINYLETLEEEAEDGDSKAAKRVVRRDEFQKALEKAQNYDKTHPKKQALRSIIIPAAAADEQTIVFSEEVDTGEDIVEFLNEEHDGLDARKFVGQSGMTQKEQKEVLEDFRNGEFDVLVATSVAEEGLDIPATRNVVFYEPVSNPLRKIQRQGRTARDGEGDVYILIGKGTRDEGKFYAAKRDENKMKEELSDLADREESLQDLIDEELDSEEQAALTEFEGEEDDSDVEVEIDIEEEAESASTSEDDEENLGEEIDAEQELPQIITDSRELKSTVGRELYDFDDVDMVTETLDVGDFIVGPQTVVERKETTDLIQTLTGERSIFEQVGDMVNSYDRAVLLIEGSPEDLYKSGVNPNAIRGLIDSVTSQFNVDLIYTTGEEDTARWIRTIAKRAQDDSKSEVSAHGDKKTKTLVEQQEYIVSSIQDIGPVTSQKLLEELGSVQAVFTASVDELMEIEGIGKKTAENIVEKVTAEYDRE